MFAAVNKLFAHGGREYHLQAEDLGPDIGAFEARVYDGGAILWRKRVPYAEVLDKKLPREEEADAVRALMDKTLHTVQAAIVKGKLTG
jgi:hypothetical protein